MEFGGTKLFPDAEFHPTQVSVVLTKTAHSLSATKE